ncbi:ThiF family adenylyltransferase [Dyadobacter sp. Leaf189]|uniref:ThiF family adenylyltransferase n=1 Tax=Dyadobacter sp. Leaf189 TaxID=1736295 RepID=UPI0006F61BB3|nr:ThiF family adenylyltransferase [Dyadobacter sp. Leaf189]KQS30822.1 thiamine biosynthesis protein ThiF [Dyadobacter sp. Leaf189]
MDSMTKCNHKSSEHLSDTFKPVFYQLDDVDDKKRLDFLLERNPDVMIFDTIYDQLFELVKIENAVKKLDDEQAEAEIRKHLDGRKYAEYGVWVFYPWSRRLVHLLDCEAFYKVRTNRNNCKITTGEQQVLSTKKVGIIGLSIGHAVAMTLATERSVGELRLADYDQIELSNLNRIQTSTHNLGMNKAVVAARAIAEIDPFIKVQVYRSGISEGSIDQFLTEGGKLDVLVEVCDGIDVKFMARHKAREYGIPVVMDTSDRGMIDIERFDMEPERPVFHGLLNDVDAGFSGNLTTEEKIELVGSIIDMSKISDRLKISMTQIGKTILSWPQLASSVALGGAITADSCRKILLGTNVKSGRYYVDIDQIIGV